MMHKSIQLPVYSDYRHSKGPLQAQWSQPYQIKSPFQPQWYQPYVLQEHVTTAAQRDQKTFVYNSDRTGKNFSSCNGPNGTTNVEIMATQPMAQSMAPTINSCSYISSPNEFP